MPKISQFPSGGVAQNTDLIPVVRNGGDYTITGYNLASLASYGQAYVGTFTATAGQTVFTLPASPGSSANLAISVDGSTMVPGTDYSWTTPTTLTFTTGLTVGQTVLYRYTTSVPVGTSLAGGTNNQIQYNNSGVLNGFTPSGDVAITPTTGVTKVNSVQANAIVDASLSSSSQIYAVNQTYNRTAAEISAGVTPTNYGYAPGDVRRYGADATGSADSTTAIQAAINSSASGGVAVYIPTGTYKTTSALTISSRLKIYGDGNRRSLISLNTSSTSTYAISISLPDNSSIVGLDIGGIGIIGNAGSASGCGIYVATTSTNSAISQSILHDIYITNVTTGVQLNGIIYMCTFRNITVTGAVATYGWYSPNPYSQTLYNSFTDLEVTNTGAGAYAFYMNAASCQFRNLTADGCCYFNGAYTHVQGLAIETINGATTPSTYCIQANQLFSLSDVDVINVPNSKCTYGIDLQGPNCNLSNVRFPDSGAGNQPNNPINLHAGNVGTISNVLMDRAPTNLIETYLSDAILNNFVITGCNTITNRGLSYLQGTWTPTFPLNWTTSPTVISAQYVKVGRQVTVTMYANNGVSTAGAQIGGLPFTANSTQGAGAYGGSSAYTTVISGSIVPNGSIIQNIAALTLTGVYWQITATYFV